MGALKDLWQSERGLVAIALIAAVTVLTGMGFITPTQWLDYTKWIFITYAAAKTVTSSVETMSKGGDPNSVPSPAVTFAPVAAAAPTLPISAPAPPHIVQIPVSTGGATSLDPAVFKAPPPPPPIPTASAPPTPVKES